MWYEYFYVEMKMIRDRIRFSFVVKFSIFIHLILYLFSTFKNGDDYLIDAETKWNRLYGAMNGHFFHWIKSILLLVTRDKNLLINKLFFKKKNLSKYSISLSFSVNLESNIIMAIINFYMSIKEMMTWDILSNKNSVCTKRYIIFFDTTINQ